MRARRAIAGTLAAATLLVTGGTACGGGDDSGAPDLPDGAVAAVGDEEISEGELRQQVAVLRRAQPEQSNGQLQRQALTTLLAAAALEQEAAARDIVVSRAAARQRWSAVARAQFPTRRALRRFLGGQSEQDLVDQLRLQMLSERLHAEVAEKAGGGKQGAKAIARFQQELLERWGERTTCRDGATAGVCPKPD